MKTRNIFSLLILAEICQPPRLFRPPFLFETRECHSHNVEGIVRVFRKNTTRALLIILLMFLLVTSV